MGGGHNFDRQSVERISRVVRTVEGQDDGDDRYRGGRHGGGGVNYPPMLEAGEAMSADDTAYDATYLEADGTTGSTISVRRSYGIYISSGDVGFLGIDTDGMAVFCPANMREENNMPLIAETRTDDPGAPASGRIWYRTDL